MKKIYFLFISGLLALSLFSQQISVVSGGLSPQQMVEQYFISTGINAFNIQFTGDANGLGLFQANSSSFDTIFNGGIVMSTGLVSEAVGPNNSGSTSGNLTSPGDNDLNSLIPQLTQDATVIEFDFIPASNNFEFRYVFGSEEYLEYVNTSFNDVFAFFLTGLNPAGGNYNLENIALIPGTSTPVSINNVNNLTNSQYFINNGSGSTPNNEAVEFDGYTTALTAGAAVFPNQTYHIKIAIGDAGDSVFDSGVFLEVNSFKSIAPTTVSSFADEQGWWLFGMHSGVTWCDTNNYGIVTSVSTSSISTQEGMASISDDNCNLLFYSDGITVWNAVHQQMLHGNNLYGNPSSTQSALIVPKPLDPFTYYIFTVASNLGNNGLCYSRVDMTMSNGYGDVDQNEKNVNLHGTSTEKISATVHANGTDIWVVTHPFNSNEFYSYLITSNGISQNPIISNVGDSIYGTSANCRGYMKFSPSGSKIAFASEGLNKFELFDFDKSTGIISNQIILSSNLSDAYGVEFSPDEHYLYGTSRWDNYIYNWDITLPTSAGIIGSIQAYNTGASNYLGALQLAPDGFIYVAESNMPYLSRISDPMQLNYSIGFDSAAVALQGSCREGLPNFMTGTYSSQVFSVYENIQQISCFGSNNGLIELYPSGGTSPYSFSWNNGQTNSSILNLFAGNYFYSVYDSLGDSITGVISMIEPSELVLTNTLTNISCFGNNNGEITCSVSGGTPPYSYIWNTGDATNSISNLFAGVYTVTVIDNNGCVQNASSVINQPDEIIVSASINQVSCYNCIDGDISLNVSGGTIPYTFLWSTGETGQNISNLTSGIYTVTITDNNNCVYESEFEITGFNPEWNYTITSNNHTILIQSISSITINGVPIENGDYIGVFYDSLGTLTCAGYTIWNGSNTTISAWGEDVGNDGFVVGEEFKWKIWDASTNTSYDANPTYMPVPPMANQGYYAINGLSGIISLESSVSQIIYFNNGWSFFSTYMLPIDQSMEYVLSPIEANIEIVKDYLGMTYWPAWNVNLIGDISVYEGYQIKMNSADTLEIDGLAVLPDTTQVNVPIGWSFIPYLRNSDAPVDIMLNSIVSDIEIVKDYLGNAYWPAWNVNLIGDMRPGEAYQIKMNTSATLIYPAN